MTGTIEDHPEHNIVVVKRDTVTAWAAKNAYTLIFLSAMFIVTWAIIFIVGLIYGPPN